jgi:hypothetical protein
MRNFPIAASLLLALSPIAFTTALAAQEAPAAEAASPAAAPAPVWAFEASDVPVDPGYTFGQLGNGMRYIIRRNATPEGTALVRLRVDSGSLAEREDERGLSHYLEHMAFNGSEGIPEGEMVKLLEREGLAFGADTNASTAKKTASSKLTKGARRPHDVWSNAWSLWGCESNPRVATMGQPALWSARPMRPPQWGRSLCSSRCFTSD